MSVGLQVDRAVLDSHVGRLALDLRNTLEAIARLRTWVDSTTDAELLALGYVQAEVDLLRSAVMDLGAVVDVARGDAAVATPRNHYTFARRLLGVN